MALMSQTTQIKKMNMAALPFYFSIKSVDQGFSTSVSRILVLGF